MAMPAMTAMTTQLVVITLIYVMTFSLSLLTV